MWNDEQLELRIIAIDHNNPRDGLCDGLPYSLSHQLLLLVELKNVRKNWITDGEKQLRKTIELFKECNQSALEGAKVFAHLCNKCHPNFHNSQKVLIRKFKNETGVRLFIEQRIKV